MLVQTHDIDGIRVLTLNDPERRNPLSQSMVAAILEALELAEEDKAVKAVVFTGNGPAFSAGVDLEFLRNVTQAGAEANMAHSKALLKFFYRIYTFSKPTIAACHAHTVAGGAGLASACDLIVMSQAAKIGYTEAKIGFVAGLVGVLLLRTVGEKHAKELLLTGRLFSAQHAYRMGLVNQLVAPEKVLDTALELAREIIANAPTSLSMTKELLHSFPGMGLEDGLRLASVANAWVRETGDLVEGITAFFEKRPPNF